MAMLYPWMEDPICIIIFGSPAGTLGSAEIATYTASYTRSAAAYSGSVRNRVIVTSSSPGNTDDVIDIVTMEMMMMVTGSMTLL